MNTVFGDFCKVFVRKFLFILPTNGSGKFKIVNAFANFTPKLFGDRSIEPASLRFTQ
jgi:hypothetical protein